MSQEKDDQVLTELVWVDPEDFASTLITLQNNWNLTSSEIINEEERDEEDGYVAAEYYDDGKGNSAEVFFYDEDKMEIADIRFWITYTEAEKKKFIDQFEQLQPDWEPPNGTLVDPYKAYLYSKVLRI